MPSQRYKLTLSYRGTAYHGWQTQSLVPTYKGPTPLPGHGIPTIQEILSRALGRIIRHPITLVGSSRTDAGVHAKGQLAHFDTDQTQIPPENIRRALNHSLPPDILVRRIEPVDDSFNAVTSTTDKRYQYVLWNAPDRHPFAADLMWHRWQNLDLPAMQSAAAHLVGTHDFASFARPGHGRESTIRTLLDCSISQRGPLIVIAVHGTGFLWNMVRIIVGTLVEVGQHRIPPTDIPNILAARTRTAAGTTAPPHGLYLHWIRTRPTTLYPTSSPT
ncbi:MAG: tRNA pseudouridine(38-40) synthase TruA [Phycisphaerales bacterium]|jgi:tRNA pseudouridine38-40 synthase|nr:tRNA pseudouridine(38-40) synthase TruA [Phycisphaerales bacterium]